MKYKNRKEIIDNILDVRLRFTGMKEGNLKYTNDGKSYPLINIYCYMNEVLNMNFNSMETLRTLLELSDCVQVYFKDECQLWECNKLTITITGGANSGKSTLSRLLNELLVSGGFEVDNVDLEELLFPVDSDIHAKRVCSLLDKETKITIDNQDDIRSSSQYAVSRSMDGEVVMYVD